MVRANDLIWSSVVSHYLLDKEAPPSDILHWFADGAHIPKAFLLDWTRHDPRRQRADRARRAGDVDAPAMVISLKDDHVSAWQATYDGAKLLGGETRFLLGGSGHNAGVINPPSANKHGYWTNETMPDDGRAMARDRHPPRGLAGGRNGRPGWSATAASG